ncbi:translation initiation factor IF-2 subunit gamma [archaeon]|nr:translation initiation factor IF-2 subunit gamma [archaeon]|tara:strand:- start:3026 stop:4225 length:1200 start_codon:yes stop_codon:yes gene_type:complete
MKSTQPSINIAIVGHVDHGKTTLTEKLSGKWTDTHSEELKRGITIRLGYANASFYKCEKCKKFTPLSKCECGGKAKFLRKISFVDSPGHESLMATMLAGASITDAALLLIAANEPCPQPQTKEHLMALNMSEIKDIIIIQNKIDLVSKEEALKNYKQIKKFVKGTIAEKAPIIPISAQHNINIDTLIETIEKKFKNPKKDTKKNPLMFIARSFDINKPGSEIKNLHGGVLGGSLVQGKLKDKDEIEIRPGIKEKGEYKSIKAKIVGLESGGEKVKEALPYGSLAILTELDPSIVKNDNLAGNVLGKKLPEVRNELTLKTDLLKTVIGTKKEIKTENIKKLENLMLNVNAAATIGVVEEIKKNQVKVNLKLPVCAEKGTRVTISRLIESRWRLIGIGIIE